MFKPNPLFTDGCVLRHGREIAVFGEADSGARVKARLTDREGVCLGAASGSAREGRFLLYLPPQEPAVGCVLTIVCGAETFRAEDVAVGELWLAGGQSNMELPLMNADGGAEETAAHDDPLIRFFEVPKYARFCPEGEEAFARTRWQRVKPGEAGWVSAVAYWFAKRRRADWPEMPIGVIDCWWGGTSISCWLDEETLRQTAVGTAYLTSWEENARGVTMDMYLEAERRFTEDLAVWNKKVEEAKKQLPPDAPWAAVEAIAGLCPWNPPAGPGSPYRPAGVIHTMLERVVPAALSGILYYQGEEDTCRTDRYDLLMAQLIALWRRRFGDGELPFLFVQLPGWDGCGEPEAWARLRWQQERVHRLVRGTGMAVALDVGDRANIHPTDKRPVGERLADEALRVADGRPAPEAPRITGLCHRDGEIELRLSEPVTGNPIGFEILDTEGGWTKAEALLRDDRIILPGDPLGIRYAWANYPETDLRSAAGLPLAPWIWPE